MPFLLHLISFSQSLSSLKLSDNLIEKGAINLTKACADLKILQLGGNPIAKYFPAVAVELSESRI